MKLSQRPSFKLTNLMQDCSFNWRGIPKKFQNDISDVPKPESTNNISSGAIAIARLFPQLARDSKKASRSQVRRSKASIHKQYQFRSRCYRKTVPSIGEGFQKSFKVTSQTLRSLNLHTISVQEPLLSQDCSLNWRGIPTQLQNHKSGAPKSKS